MTLTNVKNNLCSYLFLLLHYVCKIHCFYIKLIQVLVGYVLSNLIVGQVLAADLIVEDGVVIKFGTDAQLVARDRLVAGKGVILTSNKDDTIAGQTGPEPQFPAAGDWLGLRIERSAFNYSNEPISDLLLRFGGKSDGERSTAAFTIRSGNPIIQYLQITDSVIGLRLAETSSPIIKDSSFLRNNLSLIHI